MTRHSFLRFLGTTSVLGFLTLSLAALGAHRAAAQPSLDIRPITWDVVGLDSNNVNAGPDCFLVGARVTNTGNAAATNLVAELFWDSANSFINLYGTPVLTRPSLAAGAHEDVYFNVVITRNPAAYATARRYHIEARADNAGAVSTPQPRQLYVQPMLSQGRNSLDALEGPSVMYLGQTYQIVHQTSTATNGYEQLQSFLSFPNDIFRIVSTDVTYSTPRGATNDQLYADACGWDPNPLSPTYLSCVGPENFKKGKVGGEVRTVYTVEVIAGGVADLTGMIVDLSGGSYHYTRDFNDVMQVYAITVLPAPPPGFVDLCYAAASGGNRLVKINNGQYQVVGSMGAGSVEALTLAPGGQSLFGADGNRLGTFNLTTGQFVPRPSTFGAGRGAEGLVSFADVRGITFDLFTLKMYGVSLRPVGTSVLFQIDPATGGHVVDAFGPGLDYVAIQPVAGLVRIEDVAIDPADGQMYGIVSGLGGLVSRLAKIDKRTGATQDVGLMPVSDMQGLSFSSDGSLRGTTGNLGSASADHRDRLWILDKRTADARLLYVFPQFDDFGGLACMASSLNAVSGAVFRDDNGNGTRDGAEPGLAGATVHLVFDANGNGAVDAGEAPVQSAVTGVGGSYSFTVGSPSAFLVVLDVNSVTADAASLTTPAEQAAHFAGFGVVLTGRDFGVFPVRFAVSDLVLWGDTATDGLLDTADTVAFEISIVNLLKVQALNVDVSGELASGLSGLRFAHLPLGANAKASTPRSISARGFAVRADSTETIVATGLVCESVEEGTLLSVAARVDWTGDGAADLSDTGSSSPVAATIPAPAAIPDFCAQSYTMTTAVGEGKGGLSGDGGPAPNAHIWLATQVCLDAENNLYIADRSNHVIRKVDRATNTIATVAGVPHTRGYSGDGGPATAALLSLPSDVCVQGTDLYIAEMGSHVIRKVDLLTGVISTVAGNGTAGYSGDGGPATSAQLNTPRSVLVDIAGNIHVGDTFNFAIRRVDTASGVIESILGTGTHGHSADGEAAQGSPVEWVMDLAMTSGCDGEPVLYFTEQDGYNLIRRIVDGKLETVVGQLGAGDWGDCGLAELASLKKPYGIAFDTRGNLYIADAGNHKVRMVDVKSGLITSIAGTGVAGYNGDDQLGSEAQMNGPTGVAVSTDNILYIVDRENNRVRAMDLDNVTLVEAPPFPGVGAGLIDTIAGTGVAGYEGDGGDPRTKPLNYPGRVAVDGQGNVIVADRSNHRIRKIYTNWRVSTIAGTGRRGYSGDGAKAIYADLNFPTDLALAPDGSVFFTDQYNHVVRRIDPAGVISTVAGTGTAGFNGDGAAPATQFSYPDGLALAGSTLFISDWMNHRVRALDLASGQVVTVAGNGVAGRGDELVAAVSSPLNTPQGLDVDAFTGALYIAERGNNRVRCLAPDGTIFTWAGNGIAGYSGDGLPATDGRLSRPMDVVVGLGGELYIAEYGNHVVRVADPTGVLGTLGGVPLAAGYAGDEGPATSALLNSPFGLAINGAGDLFISDRLNHAIRVIGH